jgi:hypothetical protein
MRAFCELTWERVVKQAGRMPLSVTGSILESMPRSTLGSVLKEELEAYIKQTGSVQSIAVRSIVVVVYSYCIQSN